MKKQALQVILAQPRGFCAGVVRAVDIVERALQKFGPPVYVRHEIVHNKHVVDSLRAKGARFVEDVDDIPKGAVTVFSAHGVARKVEVDAQGRGLQVIDATCPLVSRVHNEARRFAERGYEIVLIGHPGHPEVEGTMGQVQGEVHLVSDVADAAALKPGNPARLGYVTQTTLSVDDTREIIAALKARFPQISGPDVKDICYATQNRQSAVRMLAARSDVVFVIGAGLQLELQPAAGARRGDGDHELPHSRCRQSGSGVAGRSPNGGDHGRSIGSGSARAGPRRPPPRPVRRRRERSRRHRGARHVQVAARAARRRDAAGIARNVGRHRGSVEPPHRIGSAEGATRHQAPPQASLHVEPSDAAVPARRDTGLAEAGHCRGGSVTRPASRASCVGTDRWMGTAGQPGSPTRSSSCSNSNASEPSRAVTLTCPPPSSRPNSSSSASGRLMCS